MKKTPSVIALSLTVVLSILLTSCTIPQAGSAGTPNPETASAPVSDEASETAAADPAASESSPVLEPAPETAYDFSDIELPPFIMDQSGFENSNWGDSMETVIVDTFDDGKTGYIVQVNKLTKIAGLDFCAEYRFQPDEGNALRLVWGTYSRYFHVNAYELTSDAELKKAIECYKALFENLAEVYGPPKNSYIVTSDSERIDGAEKIDDFSELRAREVNSLWFTGTGAICILSLTVFGDLRVQFYSELYR